MPSIHDLELAHLPIETAEFGVDPMPFFDRARRQHGWLAASSLGHVVMDYRDVEFPQGTMLIFPISIAGRDPAVFSNASAFDPDRPEKAATLAFGRGMHFCLGKYLAQANVEEGAHLIAQRITNPRLAGEVIWRGFPGVWGIKSLPIEFDPAPARA